MGKGAVLDDEGERSSPKWSRTCPRREAANMINPSPEFMGTVQDEERA